MDRIVNDKENKVYMGQLASQAKFVMYRDQVKLVTIIMI